MSIEPPPVSYRSVCLARWCAGQCKMKWCMVSVLCSQDGQVGDKDFPMRNRYLASGMWPIFSCVIKLADFLGSLEIVLM